MSNNNETLSKAYALYQNEKLEAAKTALMPILSKPEAPAKAYHLAALIARDNEDLQLAQNYLRAGLSLTPTDHEMLNTLGTVAGKMQDPIRAQKAFDAALNVNPSYEIARKNRAFMHLQYQNPRMALAEFDALIKDFPDDLTYRLARIYALKDTEHCKQALTELDTISNLTTKPEELAFLRSQILFQLGDYEKAIAANNAALSSPIFGPRAIANTAQLLHMLNQWTAADAYLAGMLTGEEHRSEMSVAAARAYHAAGDSEAASAVLDKAARTVPDNPDIMGFRGRMHLDAGRVEAAYADTLAALQLRPGDLSLMAEFARAAMSAGKITDAMHVAQSALTRRPNDQFWMAMRATGGRLLGTDYHYYFNYETYVRVYDLKAPIGYTSIDAFNIDLKKRLGTIHDFSKAPLDQSVRAGVQTSPNLVQLEDPILKSFFVTVRSSLDDYMATIGTDQTHPLTRRNTGYARPVSAWSIRLSKGGHHVDHIHPEGWISSSYYVDVPDEVNDETSRAGWIRFGRPPLDIGLEAEHYIQPKAGRLVLFPSYMWHGTVPLRQKDTRLTLPFDVLPDMPR